MFTETGGEDLFFPNLSSRRWPQRRQLEDPQEVVEHRLPAALTPQPLATQTKVSPEMRGASPFLREPRGGSTSAVRSGKEPLIAQEEEEKSLIWGPRRCSSLQPHAELISTRAKDRKEETARRKKREVCWWAVDTNGAVLLPSSSSPTSDFRTAAWVKINISIRDSQTQYSRVQI